jgi:hypothetical protein
MLDMTPDNNKKKTMKKNVMVTAALLCMQFALYAQSEKETRALFNDFRFSNIGFMASPYYHYSEIDGSGTSVLGFRGGILFNDKLSVGGFYSFSVNEIVPKSETDPRIYMDYRVGGGFIEYTFWPDKLVHLTIPLFIGGGEVEMDLKDSYSGNDQNLYGEKFFFIIEPSANLEINLHKFLRLNAGVGYRMASNMTYRNFDQSALTGFTGNIGLKLGLFKRNKR